MNAPPIPGQPPVIPLMPTAGGGMAQPYAGLRIGKNRVPIDKKYAGNQVVRYAGPGPSADLTEKPIDPLASYDNLHIKGMTSNLNERDSSLQN